MEFGKLRLSMKALGGVILLTSTVFAAPITVINHSFETLPPGVQLMGCGANCAYSVDAIPGWVISGPGATGQFQPGTSGPYFDTVPDGTTVAYTNNGTISQTVAPTVQLGAIYTLLVDVGLRRDISNPGSVQLLIGGNAPIVATGVAPLAGNWSTYIAMYTGVVGDVGKSISIGLTSPSAQGDWDNVRLDASVNPVPEPAALSLIGIGFAGMCLFARRRRA
jgi:hypothetical protein